MTAAKHPDMSSFHQPLLPEPQPQPPQYVIVLPRYAPPLHRRILRRSCQRRVSCYAILSVFLLAAAYLLWPSDPALSIVRLRLDRLNLETRPKIWLDLSLNVTVKVQNRDFYSIDYDSLLVAIGYRGKRLGFATSDGGHIRARGSSYVDATLQLDGVEVLSDVIFLIEDLARGAIPFDTVSETKGKLGLFFFNVPLKAKISCEVIVNTRNQTIAHQSCYPLLSEVK